MLFIKNVYNRYGLEEILMNDSKTTIKELKDKVLRLISEREWEQFHSPQNVSAALSVEASELMEKFLWMDDQESHQQLDTNRREIEDELADVIIAALSFCNACDIDVASAVEHKLQEISEKYPIEKVKGSNVKYTKL